MAQNLLNVEDLVGEKEARQGAGATDSQERMEVDEPSGEDRLVEAEAVAGAGAREREATKGPVVEEGQDEKDQGEQGENSQFSDEEESSQAESYGAEWPSDDEKEREQLRAIIPNWAEDVEQWAAEEERRERGLAGAEDSEKQLQPTGEQGEDPFSRSVGEAEEKAEERAEEVGEAGDDVPVGAGESGVRGLQSVLEASGKCYRSTMFTKFGEKVTCIGNGPNQVYRAHMLQDFVADVPEDMRMAELENFRELGRMISILERMERTVKERWDGVRRNAVVTSEAAMVTAMRLWMARCELFRKAIIEGPIEGRVESSFVRWRDEVLKLGGLEEKWSLPLRPGKKVLLTGVEFDGAKSYLGSDVEWRRTHGYHESSRLVEKMEKEDNWRIEQLVVVVSEHWREVRYGDRMVLRKKLADLVLAGTKVAICLGAQSDGEWKEGRRFLQILAMSGEHGWIVGRDGESHPFELSIYAREFDLTVQTMGMRAMDRWLSEIGLQPLRLEARQVVSYVKNIQTDLDKCVPLTFMLAFFVTVIVDRWKNIFANIGFIENTALAIATLIRGDAPQVVLARRTIVRYLVLTQVLVFRDISMKVRRRFPNIDSIVKSGFLQEHEAIMLEEVDCPYNKYWVPINWASAILHKTFKDGNITAPPLYNAAWQEIKSFRSNIALLCNFDWVPIPLAYPQVVFIAVRFYFVMCLFSRQHLDLEDHRSLDYYFPLLTVFQFIFFMGWLKVAEGLLNPLGEDDDDFECNFLIDKNIATGMAIVDQTFDKYPEMKPDKFNEPEFAPFYPEDVINTGADHALIGSAQTITLAEPNENIDMHKVDMNSPIVTGITDSRTSTFRRRLSSAFGKRSLSVQNIAAVKLEPDLPFSKSMAQQRPYNHFELSNGFTSNNFGNSSQPHLEKLEEEDGSIENERTLKTDERDELKTKIKDELSTGNKTEGIQSEPSGKPIFILQRSISEDANAPISPTLPFNTTIQGEQQKIKF